MKENVLEIEFIPVWDKWVWRITKQDEEIFERGEFYDKELKVKSSSYPCYFQEEEILCIKGKNKGNDNFICFCTSEEKILIEHKVKSINEKYGIKKKWRAKKNNNGTLGQATLKSMINDERTKNKFKEMLGNKAAGFLTSLMTQQMRFKLLLTTIMKQLKKMKN